MLLLKKDEVESKTYFMNQEDREKKEKKRESINQNCFIKDNRMAGRGWN